MIAVAENVASTPMVRDRYGDPVRRADTGARGRSRRRALGCQTRRDPRPRRRGAGLLGPVPGGPAGTTSERGSRARAGPGSATWTSTARTPSSARCRSWPSTAGCWPWSRSASPIRRCGNCCRGAGERLLVYLGLGAALGLLASWLLSRRIKRHTRGLEVAEIASLADHREALLHSIREGVVGVDTDGEITVLNDSAQELLGVTDDAIGRRVDAGRARSGGRPSSCSPADASRAEAKDVVITTRTQGSGAEPARRQQPAGSASVRSPRCATAPNWRRCRPSCRPTRA